MQCHNKTENTRGFLINFILNMYILYLFMLVLTSLVDLPHQTSVTDMILCAPLYKLPEHT
jgi:uncharacterized protein HemY